MCGRQGERCNNSRSCHPRADDVVQRRESLVATPRLRRLFAGADARAHAPTPKLVAKRQRQGAPVPAPPKRWSSASSGLWRASSRLNLMPTKACAAFAQSVLDSAGGAFDEVIDIEAAGAEAPRRRGRRRLVHGHRPRRRHRRRRFGWCRFAGTSVGRADGRCRRREAS